MPPKLYVVAADIGTAFWIQSGVLLGCAMQLNGEPDWANSFEAQVSPGRRALLSHGLNGLAEHIERAKAGDLPRP
jgi:hypothetical protein